MSDAVERSGGICELCEGTDEVSGLAVAPRSDEVAACAVCRGQIASGELDPTHWFCLQGAAWSEVPAVQVMSYRLLQSLTDASWAADLVSQLYLDDDTLSWAEEGADRAPTLDSNGTRLADGDNVTLIKDLDVKGANFVAKRGTLVKGIRLGDDPGLVEGRVNKTAIYLKTEFLKKV